MYSIKKQNANDLEFTIIEVKQPNIEVTFLDYGATVLSLLVPDKEGTMETVLLAYDQLETYIEGEMYLNAIVGPSSGRIKDSEFTIDNTKYHIDKNFMETVNLHGGKDAISFKFFTFEIKEEENQTEVTFSYDTTDTDSMFPGNQLIQIVYTVKEGELHIQFKGETTAPTLLNLTSHMYFNLSGNIKRKILDNELQIKASKTISLDEKFVPFKVTSLKGTHLDFLEKKPIKENFYDGIYNRPEKGIDNPYLLDEIDFGSPSASLKDPISKRRMDVYTTYPALVCYTHNYPNDLTLAYVEKHEAHLAICFETQNPPNGINMEGLEKSILRPGETYAHNTLYKFSVEE